MTKMLCELFSSARVSCVEWEGKPLYSSYRLPAPSLIVVEFLKYTPYPIQRLGFNVDGGLLVVNDVESPRMSIWTDTAPAKISLHLKPKASRHKAKADKPMTLQIWNIWRISVEGAQIEHTWTGNAGMRIDQIDNQLLLRCSDGQGPVDFNDLEAALTIIP